MIKDLGSLSQIGSAVERSKVDSKPNPELASQFQTELQKATLDAGAKQQAVSALRFSAHAVERMQNRGIRFTPDTMKSIEGAISKASAKGAKDTLVIAGDQALIVSVKNNTVVTVMDRASMKENVFTNIDSTVVI